MNQSFTYRPPISMFFTGSGGIILSIIFGFGFIISDDQVWFSIMMIFFFLLTSAMGVAYLLLFFKNISNRKLVIGEDFIEIPERWKKRTKLSFSEIEDIGEFDTYDHVIEIQSSKGIHLIEQNWMSDIEFIEARQLLIKRLEVDPLSTKG